MISIKELKVNQSDFWEALASAQSLEQSHAANVEHTVADIITNVRSHGDQALIEYTNKFDHLDIKSIAELSVAGEDLVSAFDQLPESQREALVHAAARVRQYAEYQSLSDWEFEEADGSRYGQRVTPMDRVGIYVPGGKASYPSSVLMNAIPAKVAGVGEVVMVVPTPSGNLNPLVLAAAHVAGVDRVFTIGGAQAVAALAFGTQTVPAVDKIVGPGNIFVATAKRQVFGQVGIDMIAGPSEVLVLADENANPDWVAMDLFAQAEHDEIAQAILASTSQSLLESVKASISKLLPEMERKDIISKSLADRAIFILAGNDEEMVAVANHIAAEHLELALETPEPVLEKIRHAGAIFVGHYSAEVFGDYCAGPNHVLPTNRTARFASPLGVYDFQKRTSIVRTSKKGAASLAHTASVLARGEGLTAHARSAEFRGSTNDD